MKYFLLLQLLLTSCTTLPTPQESPVRSCARACSSGRMLGYEDEIIKCNCQSVVPR